MARRRPEARWIVAVGALLVAGFFAAFGLTSALTGGDEGSDAQETPAATPAPSAEPGPSAGVETDAPTSDEEPQTTETAQVTETVDPVEDAVRAPCSTDEIRFLFDREAGTLAVFSGDGQPLASVVRDSYVFDGDLCRGVSAGIKRYAYGGLEAPVYESGGVACRSPRGVDVEIHPIVLGATGRQAGNVLLVSIRGRPAVLASGVTVEDPQGRRFAYSARHCRPL
jgi:hypothetical protein